MRHSHNSLLAEEIIYTFVVPLVLFSVFKTEGEILAFGLSFIAIAYAVIKRWTTRRYLSRLGIFTIFSLGLFWFADYLVWLTDHSRFIVLYRSPIFLSLGLLLCLSAAINKPLAALFFRSEGQRKANSPPLRLSNYQFVSYYWGIGLWFISLKEIVLALSLSFPIVVSVNSVSSWILCDLLVLGTLPLVQFLRNRSVN
ncbi:MAG: hypothetical protein KME18_28005 [Phormidium tanganyikae FI6-MK23]|nr:hypothetical protein [Phormidium tanganyikae FI6-MK23]